MANVATAIAGTTSPKLLLVGSASAWFGSVEESSKLLMDVDGAISSVFSVEAVSTAWGAVATGTVTSGRRKNRMPCNNCCA